jgi:hypothetical protein
VAERPAFAEAEEILGGQIEVGDDQPVVESDDGDAEAAQDALGTRRLGRRPAGCAAGGRGRRGG